MLCLRYASRRHMLAEIRPLNTYDHPTPCSRATRPERKLPDHHHVGVRRLVYRIVPRSHSSRACHAATVMASLDFPAPEWQ
jgi:hypothetical protein